MRIHLIAVGRLKTGPLAEAYDDYAGRLTWPLTLREVEDRQGPKAPGRAAREGEMLLAALPKGATLVALDERGKQFDSRQFAGKLGLWRDQGIGDLAFVIGGADGLTETVRARADLLLAFGPQTWPHLLARVMLVEQLYRAQTILAGHPYHRD